MSDTVERALDKLRALADNDRMRSTAVDYLDDLGDAQEWLDALTELVEQIDTARGAIDTWQEAERDYKPEARDEAIQAVADVVEKCDELAGLAAPDVVVWACIVDAEVVDDA